MGDETENFIGIDHLPDTDNLNQLAGSMIELSPDTIFGGYEGGSINVHSDLAVECLVSQPELGDDFISYTHLVEVLCKPFDEYVILPVPL